jgi:hypothetical protein
MPQPDERSLENLYRRLEVLEDEKAIRTLLNRYCTAVDAQDVEATGELFIPDAPILIDGVAWVVGGYGLTPAAPPEPGYVATPPRQADGVSSAVLSHVMGPFYIALDGDRATATGYAAIYVADEKGPRVWRHAYGRWTLEKREGAWQVVGRTSFTAGLPEGRAMLKAALV